MIVSQPLEGGRCDRCAGRTVLVSVNGRLGFKVLHRPTCPLAPAAQPAPKRRRWWQ